MKVFKFAVFSKSWCAQAVKHLPEVKPCRHNLQTTINGIVEANLQEFRFTNFRFTKCQAGE